MTKDEIEKYIYDKIIDIGIERHISKEEHQYNLFEEATNYFQKENSWYVRITKDLDNGYYNIELNSWNGTSDRMPDAFLYVSESDIKNDILTAIRKIKIDEIL